MVCQIKGKGKIEYDNFIVILEYLSYSILRNNKFSNDELLTIAKFTATISHDSYYKQMINVVQNLFSVCIEEALHAKDNDSIIMFAEELYSQYTDNDIMIILIKLFLQ